MLLNAFDDVTVDKRVIRRISQFELDAAFTAQNRNVEILIQIEQLFGVVGMAARVQDRKATVAVQLVQITGCGFFQSFYFKLRQQIHAAGWADLSDHADLLSLEVNHSPPARLADEFFESCVARFAEVGQSSGMFSGGR